MDTWFDIFIRLLIFLFGIICTRFDKKSSTYGTLKRSFFYFLNNFFKCKKLPLKAIAKCYWRNVSVQVFFFNLYTKYYFYNPTVCQCFQIQYHNSQLLRDKINKTQLLICIWFRSNLATLFCIRFHMKIIPWCIIKYFL